MVDRGAEPEPAEESDLDVEEDGAGAQPTEADADRGWSYWLRERLPVWLFIAGVVATVPLVLFHYGKNQWFLRDEWFVLTDTGFPPLFEPSAGAHWILVPRLIYFALWKVWGITTYKPYLLANLVMHVIVVSMLWIIVRRSGVVPWLATAAAGVMLLFGPGEEGIVLAFQIGFTGSLAWGLVQLVLADHEGGFDWRDVLALGAGLLAITSSGVGVTTTIMVGLAILLRRGWRMALVQSAPLLAIYAVWFEIEGANTTPGGRPSIGVLTRWVRDSVVATAKGITYSWVIASLMTAIVVTAAVLVLGPWRDQSWDELRRQWAMPLSMGAAALMFTVMTGLGRSTIDPTSADSARYVYLLAALTLPTLAVSAQAVARRWPKLTPLLVVVLLLPIPFNLGRFGQPGFGASYFRDRRYILTTAVRMPFARDVPESVRPVPDAYDSKGLTIGFLLEAQESGRLEPSDLPLNPIVVNEFRVRLGFSQSTPTRGDFPPACLPVTGHMDIAPAKGDEYIINQPITISTIDRLGGRRTSPLVGFDPHLNGSKFTAELPDLQLRIQPLNVQQPVKVCPYQ